MKPAKLTAALLSAITVCTSFAFNTPVFCAPSSVSADNTKAVATLPDWIPKDNDSVIAFRNTYGATHIDNGLICVVSRFPSEKAPDDQPQGMLRYDVEVSDSSVEILRHTAYGTPDSPYYYDVVVFDPQQAGDFDIAVVDVLSDIKDPDLRIGHAVARYSFSAKNDMNISQTDIYGWLPDCESEYDAFVKEKGNVSVRGKYIIFCMENMAGTGIKWSPDAKNQYQNVKESVSSDCSMETMEIIDGGTQKTISVYKAIAPDGYETITWNRITQDPDIEPSALTADCVIVDEGETVLLANTARIRFFTLDRGGNVELFPIQEQHISLNPTVSYKTDQENIKAIPDILLVADTNPYFWDFSEYSDADEIEINLDFNAVPEQYTLPNDYKKVTAYDNRVLDVDFMFKDSGPVSRKFTMNISLLDYDTGEPIPVHSETDFMLVEPRYLMDSFAKNAIIAKLTSNPCTVTDLTLDDYELATPMHYSYPSYQDDKGIYHVSSDYRTVKLNEQTGGYDITYRLKFEPTGDITGDRRFNAEDIAEMQKWLLCDPSAKADNWKAVDFNNDNILDARDFSLMKKAYIAKRQTPVAVSMTEVGGYDGINIEWNVWEENGKYLFSYWNKKKSYINGEYDESKKIIGEITEKQYRDIMSIDYDTYIEEYRATPHMEIMDAVYCFTDLTFADGTGRESGVYISELAKQLAQIRADYDSAEKS